MQFVWMLVWFSLNMLGNRNALVSHYNTTCESLKSALFFFLLLDSLWQKCGHGPM